MQAFPKRLSQAANCTDKGNARSQKLADLCADVDSHMIHLPGVACLNKPVVLRPIVEKLPLSLKSKGEKQIMAYAEKHDDAYPQFSVLSRIIHNQARTRNDPNISAATSSTIGYTESRRAKRDRRRPFPQSGNDVMRMLKAQLAQENDHGPERRDWHLERETLFHKRSRHDQISGFQQNNRYGKEQWFSKRHSASTVSFPII